MRRSDRRRTNAGALYYRRFTKGPQRPLKERDFLRATLNDLALLESAEERDALRRHALRLIGYSSGDISRLNRVGVLAAFGTELYERGLLSMFDIGSDPYSDELARLDAIDAAKEVPNA